MAEAAKMKHAKLPLMDEVNELIEKERILLNLKLLEKKGEAEQWKNKYDLLFDTLNNPGAPAPGAPGAPVEALEAAAEIESNSNYASSHEVHTLVYERLYSWILDLSGVRMERLMFAKLCKVVFGARGGIEELTIAVLSRCSLGDDHCAALMALFRSARLHAVDLSHNALSDVFFVQLLSALKDRRATPQYLLLEGNSLHTVDCAPLLDVLTEHTWGLTLSLQDFAEVGAHSAHSKGKREHNADYKETVRHPLRVLEFLSAFNSRLDPNAPTTTTANGKTVKKKPLKGSVLGRHSGLHKVTALGLKYCMLSRKTIGALESTLRHTAATLTDLDLSFSYIGPPGAQALMRILSSANCQLVRLGLLGNAIGDAGASLLGQGITSNKTLICLDIRSNNITRTGLRSLSQPLLSNRILCIVDLRGNDLGHDVVFTLRRQLHSGGSAVALRWCEEEIGGGESVSNPLLGEVLLEIPQQTRAVGRVGKSVTLYSIDLSTLPYMEGGALALQWRVRPAPLGSYLSTASLLSLGGGVGGRGVGGRVKGGRGGRGEGQRARGGGRGRDSSDNSPYVSLGSALSLSYEVRLTESRYDLLSHTCPLATVTRGLDLQSDWAACSLLLADVPARAVLEVSVRCDLGATGGTGFGGVGSVGGVGGGTGMGGWVGGGGMGGGVGDPGSFIAFEGVGLTLRRVAPTESVFLGGEGGPGSPSPQHHQNSQNARVSNFQVSQGTGRFPPGASLAVGTYGLSAELAGLVGRPGYSVLRRLRWSRAVGSATVRWQSRLVSQFRDRGGPARTVMEAARGGEEMPPNHQSLGYRWAVCVCSAEGGSRVAAEGVCSALVLGAEAQAEAEAEAEAEEGAGAGVGAGAEIGATDTIGTETGTQGRLRAWLWRDCAAHLDSLQDDDMLLLLACVISEQPSYPPNIMRLCSVEVQGAAVLSSAYSTPMESQDNQSQEDESQERSFALSPALTVDSDMSPFFAVHNDCACLLPL